MNKHKLILCIVAASAFIACKSRDGSASGVLHDNDEPTRGKGAWQWLEVSEAEYFEAIVPYGSDRG